jgi:hypothetical protein
LSTKIVIVGVKNLHDKNCQLSVFNEIERVCMPARSLQGMENEEDRKVIMQTDYRLDLDGETSRWVTYVWVQGGSEVPFKVAVAFGPAHDSSKEARDATLTAGRKYAHVALVDGLSFA